MSEKETIRETIKETRILEAAQKLLLRHGLKKVSMSDIAEAAELSRPSLYAVFENKEAVIDGLLRLHIARNLAATRERLPRQTDLKDHLECLFNIWIVEPFASAIDTEGGKELMATIGDFSPQAFEQVYIEFESLVTEVLKTKQKKKGDLSAKDIAHILSTATRGLKATSNSLAELKRLVRGLVTMTLATVDR